MKVLKSLKMKEMDNVVRSLDRNYAKLAFDSFACFLSFMIIAHVVPESAHFSTSWMLRYGLSYAFICLGILVILRTHKSSWSVFSLRQAMILVSGIIVSTLVLAALLFTTPAGSQFQNVFFVKLLTLTGLISLSPRLIKSVIINRLDILEDKENSFIAPTNILFLGTSKNIHTPSPAFLKTYNSLGIISETKGVGTDFQGHEVLGKISDLPEIFESFNSQGLHPHHLVVSSVNITGEKLRKLILENYSHAFSLKKLASASPPTRNFFEDLTFEDLFSHSSYFDPQSPLGEFFAQRSILILGAGTQLGQKLCKTLSKLPLKNLVLCDGQHKSLSDLQDIFIKNPMTFEHHFVLTYGYDHEKYDHLINTQRPDFIFYLDNVFESQVAENNPLETISENILIPQGLIELGERYHAKAFAYVIQTPLHPQAHLSLITSLMTAAYAQGLDRSEKLSMRILPLRIAPLIAHDTHLIQTIDMHLDAGMEVQLSGMPKELSLTDGISSALFLLKTLFIELEAPQARGETIAEYIQDTVSLVDFIALRAKYLDPNLVTPPQMQLSKLKGDSTLFGQQRTTRHQDTSFLLEHYETSLEAMNELLRELIACFSDYDKDKAQTLLHESWKKLVAA